MSTLISTPTRSGVVYPECDGQPIAENTLQFRWIVTIKEGLEAVFRDRQDVFIAGDLFWYPVEGDPKIRVAPDVMIVFGRPKRERRILSAVGRRRHRSSGHLRDSLAG